MSWDQREYLEDLRREAEELRVDRDFAQREIDYLLSIAAFENKRSEWNRQ